MYKFEKGFATIGVMVVGFYLGTALRAASKSFLRRHGVEMIVKKIDPEKENT